MIFHVGHMKKLELEIKKSNFEIIKVYYNANLFGVIFDLTRSYFIEFLSKKYILQNFI